MLVQQLLNGVVVGAEYALFAVGLALVFGAMSALNLAFGTTFLAASYIGYASTAVFRLPFFPVGFLLAIVGGALVGVITERVAFWPFRRNRGGDKFSEAVASVALASLGVSATEQIFGPDALSVHTSMSTQAFHVGGLSINPIQLLNVVLAAALLAVLAWFLKFTKAGKAIRATAFKERTARLLGINTERIRIYTFAASGALGGAAGILMTIFLGTASPYVASNLLIKGFAIVVIGGMNNVWGGAVAGILLGLIESLSVAYLSSGLRDVAAYALFFIVLLLWPRGLLGTREVNRA